ncbi:MAG: DUF2807 domain-containing protein [Chitinophagales bacterium]|nr:DUF2807 domain-containing protein [Chitinophagales bacterium]
MKRSKIISLSIFMGTLLFLFSACGDEKWPCVNGSGAVVTEFRSVSGFTGVSSEMEATIYITQGSEYEVRIEAQQDVINDIRTNLSGGELEISSEHCINHSLPVNVYLTMPSINSLSTSGSGNMFVLTKLTTGSIDIDISGSGEFTTLDSIIASSIDMNISGSGGMNVIADAPLVSTDISGSGDVTISGLGSNLDMDISGSGEIHTLYFQVLTCDLKISGSGDVEVNAMDMIEGSISGSGNLYYKNSPIINVSVSGSGDIIHVD